MSNSKPLPPFIYDVLRCLNRDQLERFSIVCRLFKNFIERYFQSKPYRVFDRLEICGGMYALCHNYVRWHPDQDDYSVQQFLAGQKFDDYWNDLAHYLFDQMRPYLGPTVRVKNTVIYVAGDSGPNFRINRNTVFTFAESIYNPEHIEEMESIAYLWLDGKINICNSRNDATLRRIVAEDFQPILNSLTVLQCRILEIKNAYFSFKDYKVLYNVYVIEIDYKEELIDSNSWLEFLEQPGVKPVVVLHRLHRESIDNILDSLLKAFSPAVSPNAFKIVFAQNARPLPEFQKTNLTSGEKLELKKGFPLGYQTECLQEYHNYTLDRSSI